MTDRPLHPHCFVGKRLSAQKLAHLSSRIGCQPLQGLSSLHESIHVAQHCWVVVTAAGIVTSEPQLGALSAVLELARAEKPGDFSAANFVAFIQTALSSRLAEPEVTNVLASKFLGYADIR